MKLNKIGDGCEEDNCPAVYATDQGTYIVQGYTINDLDVLGKLGLPSGESAVEVPADLLKGIHVVHE